MLNIAVLCNELQLVKDCASSINETCETQTELKVFFLYLPARFSVGFECM